MKKSIILCLLVGLFSCTQSNTSDSGLTELTINDITKDLNDKMKTKDSTKNITISYVTLKISPNDNKSTCTPEKIVPKTEITKFNGSNDLKNFTLHTSCLYTLNMEYGSDDKAYFLGETIIGKKIDDEIDNSYNNAGSGKTTVTIRLTFTATGKDFSIKAAEGTSKTTNVVISATVDDNNSNSSTDTCVQKIENKKNEFASLAQKYFFFCYAKPDASKTCSNSIAPIEILLGSDKNKYEELKECKDDFITTYKNCFTEDGRAYIKVYISTRNSEVKVECVK